MPDAPVAGAGKVGSDRARGVTGRSSAGGAADRSGSGTHPTDRSGSGTHPTDRSGRTGTGSPGQRSADHAVTRRRAPRSLDRPLEAGDAASVLGSREDAVSTGLGERLEERRRARMRLRGTHLLILLSALATLAVVVWGVLFSPVLALTAEKVSISGADEELSAQVSQAVQPFVGTPLPRLDTGAVVASVEAVPLVRGAEVSRQWPDGLSVVVRTRVAVLAEKDGDGVALVDDQGVAVSHRADVPDGMPLVALPAEGDDRVRAASAAATTWAALPDDLRTEVEQVGADGHLVTLSLSGGRTVRWGTAEDGELKAEVLTLLLAQRPASVYDVSDPTRPVTS